MKSSDCYFAQAVGPSGAKARVFTGSERHPSASLRAGSEAVPYPRQIYYLVLVVRRLALFWAQQGAAGEDVGHELAFVYDHGSSYH
jgi:hypothetical protein